ncbi:MAG: hypothetical protein WCS69_14515 [Ignavibacteriaceae bacterium]|jgi:hypothetical protein
MIFNKIFNKRNVGRLSAPFALYFFFGVFIFPFYSKGSEDKNPYEKNHPIHSPALTSADFWLTTDIVVRISEKPVSGAKVFQNQDSNYLIRYSDYNSTFSSVYYQVTPLTQKNSTETFSQAGPRSPPVFL